jgi:hypothetical protein
MSHPASSHGWLVDIGFVIASRLRYQRTLVVAWKQRFLLERFPQATCRSVQGASPHKCPWRGRRPRLAGGAVVLRPWHLANLSASLLAFSLAALQYKARNIGIP